MVLQGTGIIAPESHPFHLHGFNFYGVGRGVGNYDPVNDPKKFNLVDPVERKRKISAAKLWVTGG